MRALLLSCLAVLAVGSVPSAAHADPLVGRWITLRSVNVPKNVVRHAGFLGESTPLANDQDRKDASFRVVPGLAGGGTVSFEAANYPGHYLRHQGFRIKLMKSDGSKLFRDDASFTPAPGAAGRGTTFRASNYPEHALRHCSHHLFIDKGDGTNKECAPDAKTFAADTSFVVEPAAIATRVSLAPVGFPEHFVRHCGFQGFIDDNKRNRDCNPAAWRDDTTFLMVPGLEGGGSVSFESVNFPGQYLRHQDFRVKLAANDGSALFSKDASFTPVPGLASDASFRSVNFPDRYLRHCNFKLFIDGNKHLKECQAEDATYRRDASFKLTPR
ncbi:MAG: AbfB domain-containing protein [Deltaproteobacteria bacterium]|nr:AbfB domain-containing protein [Deltaproteobacteria bacterium]MCW5807880.1 AbfB domain-containing protein [Deltaproteobacteria bacterium]